MEDKSTIDSFNMGMGMILIDNAVDRLSEDKLKEILINNIKDGIDNERYITSILILNRLKELSKEN